MNKIKVQEKNDPEIDFKKRIMSPIRRGAFLKYLGAASATAVVLAGCDDDGPTMDMNSVDLGSGDTGVLNYAYLLEQLEAAFYVQVVASPYASMPSAELELLTDIRNHELAHRDFFKAALGNNAISEVEFDFSGIDFSSRASVLGTAKVFEDLGVSAYNGAGRLLTDANLLLIAGKIVSVEARHASAIRDLLNPFSADYAGDDVVTTDTGLDVANTPTAVLTAAAPFVKTTIKFDNLPS